MTAKQLIEMNLAYKDMSKTDLANKLGWSPQLLNKRLNTGKFSLDEWIQIGSAIGATAQIQFTFPDGMIIHS